MGSNDPALGRSRGDLSTKIHLLTDENGLPVDFRITPGQAAECQQAILLLEGQHAKAVIADNGCDSAEIVVKVESMGAVAVIPPVATGNNPELTTADSPNSATALNAASMPSNISPLQHTLLQNHQSLPIHHSHRMRLD
jgi:hypothetical protein